MNICFLLWSPDISGGTNVIFEHAVRLNKEHNVIIVTHDEVCMSRLKWFPGAEQLSWETFGSITGKKYDIAIATWWRTVYSLKDVQAERYAYFVQSIESKFYSEEDIILRNLVELTYSLDLEFITEATWIKEYLEENYGKSAHLVRNGIRKEYFNNDLTPIQPREEERLRIIVEGPLGISFKNTELAVQLARASIADEVWLLTSTEIAAYPGVDKLFSRVPISEVGRIYSSCDVLLKLSTVEGMFGPPLECFHCGGTSISYDVTGYDEYIVDGENALVSFSRENNDVIEKINSLVLDRGKLNELKRNAVDTASRWPDWDQSAAEFSETLSRIEKSEKKEKISVTGRIADLAWGMYEKSLSIPHSSSADYHRENSLTYKLAEYIHIRYPRLFSILRKIKWSLVTYLSKLKPRTG